jgi:hypothetical protein
VPISEIPTPQGLSGPCGLAHVQFHHIEFSAKPFMDFFDYGCLARAVPAYNGDQQPPVGDAPLKSPPKDARLDRRPQSARKLRDDIESLRVTGAGFQAPLKALSRPDAFCKGTARRQ